MARSSYLKFNCPSCGHKLAGIEPMDHATQVVKRTCQVCRDRWQLIVAAMRVGDGFRIDKAEITFVDNLHTRRSR